MTLNYYDKVDITDAVADAEKRVQRTLQQMQSDMAKADGNQKLMLAAFNKVAAALETLTGEIRDLRRDLNPELDKPVRLAAPKGKTP
ncbi:MAG: hypothetical protein IT560_03035 [Alphaproteobacteria bacterium]|nr:hypothetical protein [Alphaproteobacteria bacterium]